MKRIVDGVTYNTETSTLLAKAEWEDRNERSPTFGGECEGELYQTRGGAFFLVITTRTNVKNKYDEWEEREKVECNPMTAERAQEWLLEGDVEVFLNPFEDPPEAEAEEGAGSTIYIRVPAALKRDVDEAAREANVSGNVWAMRCVEQCLRFPNEMADIWSIATGLTGAWSDDESHKSAEDAELNSYKLKTATRALEEITGLAESFAKRRFGTKDMSKFSPADFSREFQPYPK
jgi:hypothetical protein